MVSVGAALRSPLFWACVGMVIGALGQLLSLPCFLGQLREGGPYFVLFWCSCLFNIFFWTLVGVRSCTGKIPRHMHRQSVTWGFQGRLLLIGISDAANGILLVFATANTPNDLQGPLLQATIPLTLVASYFVRHVEKRYRLWQIVGAIVTMIGIFVSLVPALHSAATHKHDAQFPNGTWWAAVFVFSCVPAVLMNVYMEAIFNKYRDTSTDSYDKYLLLAWESLYQVLAMVALWWTDFLPGFGPSSNFHDAAHSLAGGFKCFFGAESGCQYAALMGILFAGFYIMSYVFTAIVADTDSANMASLIAALANPLSSVFWIAVPQANRWCHGASISRVDMIWALASLPVILIGTVMFKAFEPEKLHDGYTSIQGDGKDEGAGGDTYGHGYIVGGMPTHGKSVQDKFNPPPPPMNGYYSNGSGNGNSRHGARGDQASYQRREWA
ncbi:hypothetical protein PTSG_10924 [Salpingoeca rosetta]|uniref:EamA domain-containing protein n=1 Tax=Salpingoeca rosetta (strain ATCC 50818 / BSB-021) TaxID=946362 RepID=F2URE5_SALR5|nr:uncharacterized protein PTSG_10924 [Salpingoeca rosetta]EGD80248.1 hypothetical protein PTSG_10924 [Salpingoeca rosetta]|eukprot:XP_004988310.1 hypothetical protein PTSG_10924 [Salpingoeca rosetta]